MVILATEATVIASQAVISGAFSLSQQGMQLSLLPRLDVQQTSPEESAQSPTAPSRMTSDVRSRASSKSQGHLSHPDRP
jgi:hypothetical protein